MARPRDIAIEKPTGAAHDRTRAAIVEAAIRVLADEGSEAKLDTMAGAAGVSLATLYRHFSSRDELLGALVGAANEEVAERLRDAALDDVQFREGLARVARAAALSGKHFVVFHNELLGVRPHRRDEEYERAMDGLFERGRAEGCLRPGLSTPWLREGWSALLVAAIQFAAAAGLGAETTAALVVDQFLAGAQSSDYTQVIDG